MLLLVPLALALDPPEFDVERGLYDEPFTLSLTAQDSDDSIYIAFGSGVPDRLYLEPMTIETTMIVRAMAVASDGEFSEIATHTYVFLDQVLDSPVMDSSIVDDPIYGAAIDRTLAELPTISLVSGSTIDLTEIEVSFEWFEPGGDSLGAICGAKKVGNASVNYPKHNFRLYFRNEYGPSKLSLDLYPNHATGVPPADKHDALNLRSGSHDSVFYLASQAQYLRNRWMDESQLEMGHIAPHGRYGHLYLNGIYNGVFHIRERFNAAMLAEYLGGSEDDYEAVNGGSAVDGSGAAWSQVKSLAGDYEAVQSWLNVENLLDYMILNYYAANAWDWLYYHNWMGAGPTEPDRGGYVFHSSDSDICLVYDYTTNILHLGGPDNVFSSLLAQGHPDFKVLLADRLQAHLGPGGLLSPGAAADRYDRLAVVIEEAMAAETARWGSGWWERDFQWITERSRLMNDFFPYRTDELIRQVREIGWLTVPAPELDLPEGLTSPGSIGTVSVPEGLDAELWLRFDGGDPRESGGEIAAEAIGPDSVQAIMFSHSAQLQARLRLGGQWGPVAQAFIEIDEPPPLVLNEWNAVAEDRALIDGDDVLGSSDGNGGDWLEFVVLEDGLDLRGWQLKLSDRLGDAGLVVFEDLDVLADLPAGTLFTIAEDLPQDLGFDPDGGDWRFHLQTGPFDVGHHEWQLILQDTLGWVRFGPVGEGVAPINGISSTEVGLLAATPGPETRRDSSDYVDGDRSTFGGPNVWGDETQDLASLRDMGGPQVRAESQDTGDPTDTNVPGTGGCGCATAPGPGSAVGAWALLAMWWRRRSPWLAVAAVGCADGTVVVDDSAPESVSECYPDVDGDGFGDGTADPVDCESGVADASDCDDTDPWVSPLGTEVCGGGDEDCNGLVDNDDPDVADPLPFFVDADGDGYGAESTTACTLSDGLSVIGEDCDDSDPTIHPGAAELCDDIDQNCDGSSDDALGASAECALGSCLEVLEIAGFGADGPYWMTLPSEDIAQVWCDLTTDGGGWTLGFLRSSAGQGDQPEFGAGQVDVEAVAASPEIASGDAIARMGWFDLNEFDWTELQISSAYLGVETFRSENIPREHLRLRFGVPGYLLYAGESPYYWCGGPSSYTDTGTGQVDQPVGAYDDCKGHGSVGSGWDFSYSPYANAGLTLCGSDGSAVMHGQWAGPWIYYGNAGAAQGIWVR